MVAMSHLNRLVDQHLAGLSGAEFKLAAYLYRQLRRREQVEMTILQLKQATGICEKHVHTAAKRLRAKGLLRVEARRGYTTKYRLPSVSPPPTPARTSSRRP